MVRGTEDIIRWFDNSEQTFWRIYPHKGIASGNMIMQSKQDEAQTHGDALEQLKTKIRHLHRGTFTIAAYSTADRLPTKGYHLTEIEITQQEPFPAAISGPVGISPDDVQKQIDTALNAYKSGVELDKLRTENAELRKEVKEYKSASEAPMSKAMGAIAPYLPKIIEGFFPGAASQVAGMPKADAGPVDNNIQEAEVVADETTLTDEQTEVISDFINVLAEADPDYLNTLRRLTAAIKEQPSMITMVKNFI